MRTNIENNMSLSEILWEQRAAILELRKPLWVLKVLWAVPAFSALILLVTVGFRFISTLLIILSVLFVGYSIYTYLIWKNWEKDQKNRQKYGIAVIMIYDGFLLSNFSIQAISLATFSFRWIDPIWVRWAGCISTVLYLFLIGFMLINGKKIVKYLIEKHQKPVPPPTKFAIALPGYLVGVGIALGAIYKSSQIGLILIIGLGYLCAYLILPFAVTSFYQVYIMIRNE
jgi:hypothetical protein